MHFQNLNKTIKASNKLNKVITVKLENNKDEIIQSLQSLVGKFESQVRLVKNALINNEIKIYIADQNSRRSNIAIQGIPYSVKSKDLEDKIINVLQK